MYDVLGYGYDILGQYANSSAATYPVLDVARLKADYPDRIDVDLSKTQEGVLNVGSDAQSYLKTLAPKVSATASDTAKKPYFKVTISSSFKDSSAFSSQYTYSSYNLMIKQKRLKINSTIELMQNYVNATFLSDVTNQSPAYIVSHYGTHFLIDITLGAKLDIMYQSATSSSDRKTASSAGLDINILKIFTLSTGLNSTEIQSSKNYNQSLHYITHGGDPAKSLIGEIPINGSTLPTVNISNWQSSSTVQNSELIDIGTNSLIPIYELVTDPSKKAALQSYIVQYLENNQAKLLPTPLYCYYNQQQNKHAYNINPNITFYPGFARAYNAFNAFTVQYGQTIPIYQFINPNTQDHFLSPNINSASPTTWVGYQREGIACYGYATQLPGTVPIYIFFNASIEDHIYSPNRNATATYTGWEFRGISFYAFPPTN